MLWGTVLSNFEKSLEIHFFYIGHEAYGSKNVLTPS